MTPAEFARVLGQVESDQAPYAWGDGGRAMGRFQVHPAWLIEWSRLLLLWPHVDDTWDRWVERVVMSFFGWHARGTDPTLIAMHFHLGHQVARAAPEWDLAYAARFERTMRELGLERADV